MARERTSVALRRPARVWPTRRESSSVANASSYVGGEEHVAQWADRKVKYLGQRDDGKEGDWSQVSMG